MPSNWLIFDRIRAYARQNRIFQFERGAKDQSSLDKIVDGDFLDSGNLSSILDQTNLQINRLDRYKDYEQMDQTGEISLALDLYGDEACLVGETRIPLLNGTCPTIAELADLGIDNEFWIYSVDQKTGDYIPAIARGARVTGINVPIVEVTFDDGSSIKCTSNHLFMLRNGEFCAAKDLKYDDSLKPLYKKNRYRSKNSKCGYSDSKPIGLSTEYEFIFNGKNFTSTHRWVYHSLNSDKPQIVHHNDFNSTNNCPNNLIGMTIIDHDIIHRKYGPDNHSFNHITLDDIKVMVSDWKGPMTVDDVCSVCDIGERVLNRVLKLNSLTWSEFRDLYTRCYSCDEKINGVGRICESCRKQYLRDYHQLHKNDPNYREKRNASKRKLYVAVLNRTCINCNQTKSAVEFKKNHSAYSPYCNICRPDVCEQRYIRKSFNNHKVVSVKDCGVVDKVYDIEVPKYHCFAAGTDKSWVIVHNSLVDPERKHTLIIRAKNRRIKRELEDLFYNILQWDTHCRPTIRYLCKYGDAPFEIVLDANRTSVSALKFMSVYNFTRIETKFGDLVGFYYMDSISPKPQFLHPWQVMHLRLTSFECLYAPYGRSIIDGGRKAFKQLRLVEDAALIYRLTTAPEKRKYTIPVGNIPAHEVPEYLQMIARNFKRQRFYNPTTGTFDERYSPLIQEDNIILPRRPDGSGPDVELMQGGENVDKIADIEYFKKKMIAPTKIPFARVGIGEGAGESSEKSLSQSSSEFAKSVQWVQREVATGLTKVALVHLALRGYKVDDLKGFEIALTSTSAMEELYRIETWQTRTSVMAELKDLGWFPKEWIVTHFTDLSPDEIEELKEMESDANNVSDEGGGGGGGPPGIGGLDDMSDMDGGPSDEEDIDILSDIDNSGQPAPGGPPPLEGYDIEAADRLISEQIQFELQLKKRTIMERWAARHGKSLISEEQNFDSGFDYFISTKELDGLVRGTPSNNTRLMIESSDIDNQYDPNDEEGLLVEWSVPVVDRQKAMEEVLAIILEDQKSENASDIDEITVDDFPI